MFFQVWILLIPITSVRAVIFKLEAEKYGGDRFHIHRQGASGQKTVNFNEGQSLNFYFCLREDSPVSLHNVVYSNDGDSDTIVVTVDGMRLGTIVTPNDSQSGELWDKFMYSDQLGPTMTLRSGRHKVALNFTSADRFGVEVDFIQIKIDDEKLKRDLFDCALYCVPEIKYDNGPARDDMASAMAQRIVLKNSCPLDDNIMIPIFHENIKHYLITATLPKYRSFENHYESKEGSCPVPSTTVLWEYENLRVPTMEADMFEGDVVPIYHGSNHTRSTRVTFRFAPMLKEDLFDKGTDLKVAFREPITNMYIEIRYINKSGEWSQGKGQYITPQSMDFFMTIPPDTWSNSNINEVELLLLADPESVNGIAFDTKLLRRRIERNEEITVYNNLDVRMKAVDLYIGDPQKDSEKMSIKRLDNGFFVNRTSYLSVYQKTHWSDADSEVLRLHADGQLQILPMSPHGLEAIPLGTSLFIGSSDPTIQPPKARIEHVDIDPAPLELILTYKDGSKAKLLIKTNLQSTSVIVKDIEMTTDPSKYPFATISTMWQYDGNADVDHVSTNGDVEHHIINGWEMLFGTSFSFFRKCISRHNTQSPDIQLRLITEKDLYLHV